MSYPEQNILQKIDVINQLLEKNVTNPYSPKQSFSPVKMEQLRKKYT